MNAIKKGNRWSIDRFDGFTIVPALANGVKIRHAMHASIQRLIDHAYGMDFITSSPNCDVVKTMKSYQKQYAVLLHQPNILS